VPVVVEVDRSGVVAEVILAAGSVTKRVISPESVLRNQQEAVVEVVDVEFAEKKDTSLGNVPARERRNASDANKLVTVSPTALNLTTEILMPLDLSPTFRLRTYQRTLSLTVQD